MDAQRAAICPFHTVHEFRDCKRLHRRQKGIDYGDQKEISCMERYHFYHIPQEYKEIVFRLSPAFHFGFSFAPQPIIF